MLVRTLAMVFALLSWALLAWNTAVRPRSTLPELQHPRRYWEDVAIAISAYLQRSSGETVEKVQIGSGPGLDLRHAYRRYLTRVVEEQGIRPWEFWRTVRIKPFLKRERILPRDFDDAGRPVLTTLGFRLLGGVSPFLGLWLGVLCVLPAFLWSAFELSEAGQPVAAAVFPFLVGASAFVAETLALPYSAAGFYLVALLVLANLALFGLLGRCGSPRSLVARLLAGGGYFALCAPCRGSALLLVPAFLIVILLAMRRARGDASGAARRSSWRTTGLALGAMILFLAPYLAVRQPRQHAVWGDVWQGLGDFDASRGHYFSDPMLRAFLRRQGMSVPPNSGVEFESDQSERITRRTILREIREDPSWYAAILAKRSAVTVTQWKLRAYGPRDGQTFTPGTRPNEGLIDIYYRMTATADVFAIGPWRREVRIELLLAPSLVLVALWSAASRVPRLRGLDLGGRVAVLACVALGALALPVSIGTAASFETQAFALVHFLGFAFVLEAAARALRSLRTPGAAHE